MRLGICWFITNSVWSLSQSTEVKMTYFDLSIWKQLFIYMYLFENSYLFLFVYLKTFIFICLFENNILFIFIYLFENNFLFLFFYFKTIIYFICNIWKQLFIVIYYFYLFENNYLFLLIYLKLFLFIHFLHRESVNLTLKQGWRVVDDAVSGSQLVLCTENLRNVAWHNIISHYIRLCYITLLRHITVTVGFYEVAMSFVWSEILTLFWFLS